MRIEASSGLYGDKNRAPSFPGPLCCKATLSGNKYKGVAFEWEDGSDKLCDYEIRGGFGDFKEEGRIKPLSHPKGDDKAMIVAVLTRKKGGGHFHTRVWKLDPDHSLSGLPGQRRLTHGKFVPGNLAYDISDSSDLFP